ncbi:hypothetical protein C7974DRAFT_41962 [Boeremia exigua]|uniref:uncharacterized protein n=1 Tax=Boeremia exigua TaxID=749465 RepID=UPI001E8D844B|nr:uncharacterized protein C7974DRAFT_41962 [Boeremia exigua]KAH6616299.1 hypothetical protein C7974DRAFT_41962 [Boeremia exigua]
MSTLPTLLAKGKSNEDGCDSSAITPARHGGWLSKTTAVKCCTPEIASTKLLGDTESEGNKEMNQPRLAVELKNKPHPCDPGGARGRAAGIVRAMSSTTHHDVHCMAGNSVNARQKRKTSRLHIQHVNIWHVHPQLLRAVTMAGEHKLANVAAQVIRSTCCFSHTATASVRDCSALGMIAAFECLCAVSNIIVQSLRWPPLPTVTGVGDRP